MVPLLVLFTIIVFLTIDYFVQRAARRRAVLVSEAQETFETSAVATMPNGFSVPSKLEDIPAGVFVGPGHVWVEVEPAGSVRVGADRLLLGLLGGLDAVYAHPQGVDVRQGGPLFMLRRGGRALKVRSPVEGTIADVNEAVHDEPDQVPADPFERGWIYRIWPSDLSKSLKKMVVAEDATTWMRTEFRRLRDALLEATTDNDLAPASLADGGLPVEDAAQQVGDKEWEDMIAKFFGGAV